MSRIFHSFVCWSSSPIIDCWSVITKVESNSYRAYVFSCFYLCINFLFFSIKERTTISWERSARFWSRGCFWPGVYQGRQTVACELFYFIIYLSFTKAMFFQVKLSEYIGKKYVILFFYPLDFTFVCPTG